MNCHSSNSARMSHLSKLTNLVAPCYDLIFRSFWLGHENDFRRRLIELMNLTGNNVVLDVGCGTGTLSRMIANELNGAGNISGIDIAPRMIEMSRENVRRQGQQIDYRVGSALAIPFEDNNFDVVVTSLVYHQLMSPEERVGTVHEIWRVLRPGGRYVAAEFDRFTAGNLSITHDSLMRKIPLFTSRLLERNGFHVHGKLETSRGITIISADRGGGADKASLWES